MGSCFSQNIGHFFQQNRLDVLVNPFGTLFNPTSIASILERVAENRFFSPADLTFYDGLFFCTDTYTAFSDTTEEGVLYRLNKELLDLRDYISKSRAFFLTLGSSYIFRRVDNGQIVGNCHKLPGSFFTEEQMSPLDVANSLYSIHNTLRNLNPNLSVVVTISPVRHLSLGAVKNTVSKSVLFSALSNVSAQCDWYYFPAYEMMMDEWRDYRFYQSDMIHPSDIALHLVTERFMDTFFSQFEKDYFKISSDLLKLMLHKPRFKDMHSLYLRKEKAMRMRNELNEKYHIDWESVIKGWYDRESKAIA